MSVEFPSVPDAKMVAAGNDSGVSSDSTKESVGSIVSTSVSASSTTQQCVTEIRWSPNN